MPVIGHIYISSFIDAQQHTEDQLMYVLITAYFGWAFGVKSAWAVLACSSLIMLSRAVLISPSPASATFETLLCTAIGALILSFIRVSRGIRERQEGMEAAMASLRLSERNYRELFQNASDAIWIHDLEGRMTVANKACEKMTGYSMEELVGRNVTEFLSEEAHALARDVKRRLLNGEHFDERYEQRIIRRDGSEAIMQLSTRLVMQDGKPAAFHNIARDVTTEREMRDSLLFYLQKVLGAQEEERKRIARDLHDDTAQSLLLLTHRLDAIVSNPAGRLPRSVRTQLTQLHGLARETLEGVRRYAQELRPAILDDIGLQAALEWMADKLSAESGVDVNVQVDMESQELPRETQLTLFRIAQEALGNVKKHACATRVEIRLDTRGDRVRMAITDNGVGFDIPTRFSDLSRADKLGLLGMQERVQLLRGTLHIRSEPGAGTTVAIDIPLAT